MWADAGAIARSWRRRLYVAFAVALVASSAALVANAPDVQAAIETIGDDFATYDYTGSTGSQGWAFDWSDTEGDGPTVGAITVRDEPHCETDPCAVIGWGGADDAILERGVDLSGATAATITFDYEVHVHGIGIGAVEFRITDDGGGNWDTLATYELIADTGPVAESIDISAYTTNDARIRFELLGGADDSHLSVDNIVITSTGDQPAAIVISELSTRGVNFIELYNAGSVPVDIDGFEVKFETGSNPDLTISQGGGPVVVPAGGHYLLALAGSGLASSADQLFASPLANNVGIRIEDVFSRHLDGVGIGSSSWFEGTPIPAMVGAPLQSYERLNGVTLGNCVDTDSNLADFVHNWGFTNAQSMSDPAVPCGTPVAASHVVISEFRPDGPGGGDDEFVEIFNPTPAPVDISGWVFHITEPGLFTDYHTVPDGVVLVSGGHYLVSDDSGPTPANAQPYDIPTDYASSWGDVVLKDDLGAVVDVLGYGGDNGQLFEGSRLPSYGGGSDDRSFARRGGGAIDTDNNLLDFVFSFASTAIMGNLPPAFGQDLGDRSDAVGDPVSISAAATDPDVGQTLTYSASGLPAGIVIDPATGDITGAPAFGSSGVYAVTITATDDGAPVAQSVDAFSWTVTAGSLHYLVAGWGGSGGGDDKLTAVDLTDLDPATNEVDIGIGSGTSQISAAAIDHATGVLFAANGGQLGIIDTTTGLFAPTPSPFGTGNGSAGAVALDAVRGIAFDPSNGDLYAVQERFPNPSVLFRVDPASGAMVPGAFGGDDYVAIPELSPGVENVTDLAFHPSTGVLYAVFTNFLATWRLGTIDPATGASAGIGPTGTGMRGISFDDTGQLWGVRYVVSSSLSRISVADGSTSGERTVDNGGFYGAVAFSSPPKTNTAPVFGQDLGDRSDAEGAVISLPSPAGDADIGDTLTYSAANLPSGLGINPGTGLISGTIDPLAASGSPYNVTITVTDDGSPNLQDTDVLEWTVTDVNRPPVLDPITDPTGNEQTLITFTATGSDPDLDGMAFSLSGEPAGASIDPATGVFSWTPVEAQDGTYSFDVIVIDDGAPAMSDSQTVVVTVNETNQMPTLVDPGAQVNGEGDSVSLAITASDADDPANVLAFTASGLPPGLTIDPGSGLISGTVDPAAAGGSPYAVTITVIDDGAPSLQDQVVVAWTITNTNRSPVLDPVADAGADEVTLITFTATGSDPDFDGLAYSLTGEPAGAAIDPVSGVFTWTPTEAQDGVHSFDVVLTDDGAPNLADTQTVTVTVNEINQPPTLNVIAAISGDETTTITFDADGSDGDLAPNDLVFSLSGAPAGAAIDPVSGVFAWTPTEAQDGVHSFDVVLTDDGLPNLTDTQTVTVTVNEINVAPAVTTPADRTDAEGDSVLLAVLAEDVDIPANTLTFSAAGLPAGLSVNPLSGVISGVIDVAAAAGSPYTVVVTATDDGEPSRQGIGAFVWTVTDTNRPPVLDPIGPQSASEGTPLTFVASASDPDDDLLVFAIVGAPLGASIDATTGTFIWTPGETQDGTHVFDVVATDDGVPQLSDTRTVTVVVDDANQAPDLTIPDNRIDPEGTSIALAVPASDPDKPADVLTWSATGLPAGLSINPATGVITGTISYSAATDSPYTVKVKVVDGRGGTCEHAFTWKVTDTNRPPIVGGPGSITVEPGDLVSFTATATDPDGHHVSYGLVDGPPPGSSITPVAGLFTWQTAASTALGTYSFAVAATDELGAVGTARVVVTVGLANRAPLADDQTVVTQEDEPALFVLDAVDPDGDDLTYEVTESPTLGTLTGTAPALRYQPRRDATGRDVIEYRVTDPSGLAATARVFITVAAVNDAPVAAGERYRTIATDTLHVDAPGLLANDADVDDTTLRARLLTPPETGSVDVAADGAFRYEPDPGFVGEARFTYEVVDVAGAADIASVVIDVDRPGAVSSPERVTAVDAITAFTPDPVGSGGRYEVSGVDRTSTGVQRTLVLMSRASGVAVQQMGFPFIVMLITALAVLLLGRLRIVPLLAWRSRAVGTVQVFSADHGFGLVAPDGTGGEVFVHQSAVRRRDRTRLRPGDRVRYRVVAGEHRDLATRIRRM